MSVIEESLTQHDEIYRRLGQERTIYGELLKHGREFTSQPLPENIEKDEEEKDNGEE